MLQLSVQSLADLRTTSVAKTAEERLKPRPCSWIQSKGRIARELPTLSICWMFQTIALLEGK